MFGNDTAMFLKYIKSKNKAIYPWSLDIVDCYFLANAFKVISGRGFPVKLIRRFSIFEEGEILILNGAYDLYNIDTESYGSEVVLIEDRSECFCYWDIHERFVIASGTEEFLSVARPYPEDIQRHRYIEAMDGVPSIRDEGGAGVIYDEIVSI